jgi:hypothetical protein
MDWKERLRERLAANIGKLGHTEEMKQNMIEIEVAKAVACTDAFVGFDQYKDDSELWAIMRLPGRTLEQKRSLLASAAAAYMHTVKGNYTDLDRLREAAYRHTFEE